MSEYRAILMSSEQRDAAEGAIAYQQLDVDSLDALVAAFDAAGDQPRIRWCAEHGRQVLGGSAIACERHVMGEPIACRVMDAIVCVLPEQQP